MQKLSSPEVLWVCHEMSSLVLYFYTIVNIFILKAAVSFFSMNNILSKNITLSKSLLDLWLRLKAQV